MSSANVASPVAPTPAVSNTAQSANADGSPQQSVNGGELLPTQASAQPETVTVNGNKVAMADIIKAMETAKTYEASSASLKTKEGLAKAVQESGLDAEEFASEIMLEIMRREGLSEAERELETYKARDAREAAEKAAREATEKASSEKAAKEAQDAFVAKHVASLDTEISAALASESMPRTEQVVADIVYVMKEAADNGYDIDAAQAAQIVRARTYEALRPAFEAMTPEQLLQVLPEAAVKAIMAHQTAQLKAQLQQPETQAKPAVREARKVRQEGPRKNAVESELDRLLKWRS